MVDREVNLGERSPCAREQGGSGRRQLDMPGGPDEEHEPELALEIPDRPRKRRLRHVQALGGAAEVQLLGNRDEVPQLSQLDWKIHYRGY